MDLAQILDKLSDKLDTIQQSDLLHLLGSLERILNKTRDILKKNSPEQSVPSHPPSHPPPTQSLSPASLSHQSPSPEPTSQPAAEELQHLFRYLPQPLDDVLVAKVHEHVKGLTYHPNPSSPNSPEIYLYGEHPYTYNKQSAQVSPKPTLTSLPMSEL